MKIDRLTADEALGSLHTHAEGLKDDEVTRRLTEFGPNRVERVRGKRRITRFLQGFTHFLRAILWMAAALAFFAEFQDPGQGMACWAWRSSA